MGMYKGHILPSLDLSSFSLVPVDIVAQGYVFSVNQKQNQGNLLHGLSFKKREVHFWKTDAFRRVWGTF